MGKERDFAAAPAVLDRLGIKVSSVLNPVLDAYRVSTFLAFRARDEFMIDHEAVFASPVSRDLVRHELEHSQERLVNATVENLRKIDLRGRSFGLTKDDKATLDEMFRLAAGVLMSDFSRAADSQAKIDKFQDLMNRLFR